MTYVSTGEDVGILLNTDSREEFKYLVKLKDGTTRGVKDITKITQEEYEAYTYKPVATTKPKRGAKK